MKKIISTLVLFSEWIRCPSENTNYNVIHVSVSPPISPVKYIHGFYHDLNRSLLTLYILL